MKRENKARRTFLGLTRWPDPLLCVVPLLRGLLVLAGVGVYGQAASVHRSNEAELDRRRRHLVSHGLDKRKISSLSSSL